MSIALLCTCLSCSWRSCDEFVAIVALKLPLLCRRLRQTRRRKREPIGTRERTHKVVRGLRAELLGFGGQGRRKPKYWKLSDISGSIGLSGAPRIAGPAIARHVAEFGCRAAAVGVRVLFLAGLVADVEELCAALPGCRLGFAARSGLACWYHQE